MYKLNGKEIKFVDDLEEELVNELADYDDYFNEILDETYGLIDIGGNKFYASRILKELDPIDYEMKITTWIAETVGDLVTKANQDGKANVTFGDKTINVEFTEDQ